MTYKTNQKSEQTNEVDPSKCAAYGCPCRASINSGGEWVCFAHFNQPSDRWQSITRQLRDHEWLLALVKDVRKMSNKGENWREFASRFWQDADTFCMPQKFEESEPYCIRMLGELLWRLQLQKNRPEPRNPAVLARRFLEVV